VVEAAGFERFSVFGYSFTGAFAPWLALLTGQVDAVVSGGFPIAGDYSPLYPEIQALSAAAEADPAAWADLNSHDHEGVLAHINEAVPNLLAWFDGLPRLA
jgi:pimeloyl-ACP methyl ester carboxylesterase